MSHSDSLKPRTSSLSQRLVTEVKTGVDSTVNAGSAENVSCWTPGKAFVDISASDRQILEIHAERLVEEVFTSEIEPILQEDDISPTLRSSYPPTFCQQWIPHQQSRFMLPPAVDSVSEQDEMNHEINNYLWPSLDNEIEGLGNSTRVLPKGKDAATVQLEQLQKQGWQDRVLLGASLAALGLAMISGFATQSRWQPLAFLRPATVDSRPALSHKDPFLDYLRASLHRLQHVDGKFAQNPKVAGNRSADLAPTVDSVLQPPPSPLAAVGASPEISGSSSSKQTVAVKPITTAPTSVGVAPVSTTTALPQIPIATLPPPPPLQDSAPNFVPPPAPQFETQSGIPSAPQPAPAPVKPVTARTTAENPGNLENSAPNSSSAVIPLASASPIASAIKTTAPRAVGLARTLVGVLEMDDLSVALIDVNGTTRRVRIGETIGGDDSILLRVSNQEAVVQRGQEQRSIQLGQQF